MTRPLTPADREALQSAIDGIDTALVWLEADMRRLVKSLEAGIPLEVICEINRIIYREKT